LDIVRSDEAGVLSSRRKPNEVEMTYLAFIICMGNSFTGACWPVFMPDAFPSAKECMATAEYIKETMNAMEWAKTAICIPREAPTKR
jgi:hypothetical protein